MFKKLLVLALTGILTSLLISIPAAAQSGAAQDPQQAERIKTTVTRLGTGKRVRVEVKLIDQSKMKGYVGEIGQTHFTLINPRHGTVTPIPYNQVQQIKKTHRSEVIGLALGAGTILGVMLMVVLSMRGS